MKFLIFLTLLVFIAIPLANGQGLNIPVKTKELLRLQKQEAILKSIIENAEYIQLKDGTSIDFRNLDSDPSSFNPSRPIIDKMKEVLRAVEGGGTGAGG